MASKYNHSNAPRLKHYTLAIHVKRLEHMIETGNVCGKCPGAWHYRKGVGCHEDACDICKRFVNVVGACPCYSLGNQIALERTLDAISEYRREHKRK